MATRVWTHRSSEQRLRLCFQSKTLGEGGWGPETGSSPLPCPSPAAAEGTGVGKGASSLGRNFRHGVLLPIKVKHNSQNSKHTKGQTPWVGRSAQPQN